MATKNVEETKKTVEAAAEAAKPAEKKAPAKKAAATAKKAAATAAKKTGTAAKKTAAAAKKAVEKKVVTAVEFDGKQVDVDAVAEACKADFKANRKGNVRTLKVYIKPEDNAAYYVVNDKVEGKIDL